MADGIGSGRCHRLAGVLHGAQAGGPQTLHRASLHGREGKLYPGSWSEWSKRGLPLERS